MTVVAVVAVVQSLVSSIHDFPSCFRQENINIYTYVTLPSRNYKPQQGRKEEVFYLMTHSTHFIYGYMASDIR